MGSGNYFRGEGGKREPSQDHLYHIISVLGSPRQVLHVDMLPLQTMNTEMIESEPPHLDKSLLKAPFLVVSSGRLDTKTPVSGQVDV